jgi:hypothetical protein
MTPSSVPRSGNSKRSLPGYWTPQLIKARQATRGEIVSRQLAKSGSRVGRSR